MIYVDDNSVMVGGWVLPGLLKNVEVEGEVLYEEIEVEGRTDRPKQVTGYADGKVFIDIELRGNTKEEVLQKLNKIQRIFRKPDVKTPYAYYIVNDYINARDINLIILKKVTSKIAAGEGFNIIVNLEFFEYIPITITASSSASISGAASASYSSEVQLNQDYQNYLDNDRGAAPKVGDKTAFSPSVDDMRLALQYKKELEMMG